MLRHMPWRLAHVQCEVSPRHPIAPRCCNSLVRPRGRLARGVRDLLQDLMDAAAMRAEYADARFVRTQSEHLSTRNGVVDQVASSDSEGIGVRVRVGGSWGFAAVRGTDKAGAEAALARALALADAQPPSRGAALVAEPPAVGRYQAVRVHKLFASTEGALCEQVLTECGGGLAAEAVSGEESHSRSFPTLHGEHMEQAGYEHFLGLDLAGEAPRV